MSHLAAPGRYYTTRRGDRHTYAQLTRFLPAAVRSAFDERPGVPPEVRLAEDPASAAAITTASIRKQLRGLWS